MSRASAPIRLTIELTDAEACAVAQFLKRVAVENYRCLAVDLDEAYAMHDAGDAIRRALAEQGYAPR